VVRSRTDRVALEVLALVGCLLLLAVAFWPKLLDRPMAATGGFLGAFLL